MSELDPIVHDSYKTRLEVIKELGFFAYGTLITLNAGAFVVILSFLGNLQGNSEFAINMLSLKKSLGCFLLGITLTFVSATITYLAAQLNLLGKTLPGAREPLVHLAWLLAPVVLAFGSFLAGGIVAISGIAP